MELIDKDRVVAEIKRIRAYYENIQMVKPVFNSHIDNCNDLLDFLNTLEVKEVDLEKEIKEHIDECLDVKFPTTNIELIKKDVEYTARKFFQLGLKAKKGE